MTSLNQTIPQRGSFIGYQWRKMVTVTQTIILLICAPKMFKCLIAILYKHIYFFKFVL